MSTYDDNERSVSGSRPIDLYVIVTPTVTYRLTSSPSDVVFGGNTYTALTMSRGNVEIRQDLTGRELLVYLPITHPLVQRYCATGVPEHSVVLTASRLQQTSGTAQQYWTGFVGGISIGGHVATLRVPALSDDAMKIKLPVIAAQRVCNHTLYDLQCTLSRAFFTIPIVVSSFVGAVITVPALSGASFNFGDAIHAPSNQRRMILSQVSNVLTLNDAIIGLQIGDTLNIALGCAHDITTCRDTFNNVLNFGGHPYMNAAINPWVPSGLGVIQQV